MKNWKSHWVLLVVWVLVFLTFQAAQGETALLVVGNNAYIIDSSANGELTLRALEVDKIWINGDDDNGPNPPPTPGSVAEKVQEISARLLQSKLEAIALSTVINRLSQDDVDQDRLKEALDQSIRTLSASGLFPGNKFSAWREEVLRLGKLSSSFLKQVETGVRKAFGLSQPITLASMVLGIGGIDLAQLIQIIKLIFELLRDLGIFTSPPSLPPSSVLIPVPVAQ